MGFKGFAGFRKIKNMRLVLAACALLIVAVLIIAFVRLRMQAGPDEEPRQAESTEATLSISGFRHTATQEGTTSWILRADSARLFSEQDRAELSGVDVTFFREDGGPVDLSGRRGEFNTKTRDMSISGSVLGRYDGYILTTQSLHYTDGSNIIYTDSGITVIGSSSRFSANSGKFELDTGSLILDGHVDVRVNKVEDF